METYTNKIDFVINQEILARKKKQLENSCKIM